MIATLPETGDILFYEHQGSLTDKLISWWTKSPYVHCAIAVDEHFMIEALNFGVVKSQIIRTSIDALWRTEDFMCDLMPSEEYHKRLLNAMIWLQSKVGRRYNWSAIADDVLSRYTDHFLFIQKNHYDCSELASEFLNRLDMNVFPNTLFELETPGSLANKLRIKDTAAWLTRKSIIQPALPKPVENVSTPLSSERQTTKKISLTPERPD